MSSQLTVKLTVSELCESVQISEDMLIEIVSQGIVEPKGASPASWQFDDSMLNILKRAVRLREELDIEWAGIALALDLLDELDQLKTENYRLRQRLGRFLQSPP